MTTTVAASAPKPTRREPAGRTARTVDPTVEAIGRILMGGIELTTLALAEAPEAADLTLRQWRVLVIVSDAEGLRIGELARRLGVAEPSASRLVRRLERHGLVRAERDEADRRATNVRLSDRGLEIRDIVLDRRQDLVEHATRGARAGASGEAIRLLRSIADALAPFA